MTIAQVLERKQKRYRKLKAEIRQIREQIQDAKAHGGDNMDNQEFQLLHEELQRKMKELTELEQEIENLKAQQAQQEVKQSKSSVVDLSLVGKTIVVRELNSGKQLVIEVVSMLEEVDVAGNPIRITEEAPLIKSIKSLLLRNQKLENQIVEFKIGDVLNRYEILSIS